MTPDPKAVEAELQEKIDELLKTLLHLAVNGYGVSEDVAPCRDDILALTKSANLALLERVEEEIVTSQDKKEYWPVWRKELFERQRQTLTSIRKEYE